MTDIWLFAGFALAYLVLLAWGLWLAARHGWWTPANLPLLVVAGLVYDNALLALGSRIGEGALLESLNLGRFWIHALVTPLLVLFAWHACVRASRAASRPGDRGADGGHGWVRSRAAAVAAVVATAALVVLELVDVVLPLELEVQREYGVLSYTDASSGGGPPLMVLFVAAALIVAGLLVWRWQGWPWLLVGSVIMTIGSGVPVPVDSGAVTNAFELVLLTSILATKHHQDARA